MGLARIIYNLLLSLGLLLGAPFLAFWLASSPKTRSGFWEKMGRYSEPLTQQLAKRSGRKRIWFHAVSVGEFNAIRTLVQVLLPDFDIVITTTTRTGQTLAKRTYPELPVFYFPYDFRPVIRKALALVQPDLVILTETELWPNFIDQVTRQSQLFLINGRISNRSHQGYQMIAPLLKPYLRAFTHFYMQSQMDADRIQQLGGLPPESLVVAGNIKFDLLPTVDPIQKNILAHLLDINPQEDTVLTLASTHSGEDEQLLGAAMQLKKDFPELKIILAPRHPERANEIKTLLNGRGWNYALRSQLSEENPNRQPIVILDTIGELVTVYSFTTVAVMGGSFVEQGGQNPLEAISQRVPVIFGPHMYNFPEISAMILEQQAGFQVQQASEIGNIVTGLLTQPEVYDSIAENGQKLIENNRGAKELIAAGIHQALAKPG